MRASNTRGLTPHRARAITAPSSPPATSGVDALASALARVTPPLFFTVASIFARSLESIASRDDNEDDARDGVLTMSPRLGDGDEVSRHFGMFLVAALCERRLATISRGHDVEHIFVFRLRARGAGGDARGRRRLVLEAIGLRGKRGGDVVAHRRARRARRRSCGERC